MTDQELPVHDAQKPSGKAIASLVLGVSSLLLTCLLGPLTLPLALAGLVLGFMSLKTAGRGLGIGGMILSGIALIFALISTILLVGALVMGARDQAYDSGHSFEYDYLEPQGDTDWPEDWEDF